MRLQCSVSHDVSSVSTCHSVESCLFLSDSLLPSQSEWLFYVFQCCFIVFSCFFSFYHLFIVFHFCIFYIFFILFLVLLYCCIIVAYCCMPFAACCILSWCVARTEPLCACVVQRQPRCRNDFEVGNKSSR